MSQFLNHLYVVLHSFLDALGLDFIAHFLEIGHLLYEVVLYIADGILGLLLSSDKQIGRIDLVVLECIYRVEGQAINFLNRVYLIIPPGHAKHIVAIGHGDIHRVSFDAEVATF